MELGDWSTSRLLTTASRLWEHELNQNLSQLGITHANLSTLRVLQTHGPLTQNKIAAALHLRAQTVSRILDKLEGQDLIKRVRGHPDRRALTVHLTTKGLDTLTSALNLERLPQTVPTEHSFVPSRGPSGSFIKAYEADLRAALIRVITEVDSTWKGDDTGLPPVSPNADQQ
ncbi:MarR family transcriptional regulator [Arthrobacter cheniae]|uniref:MarR family transcriptional regulator n=1 Tax=Arthrobacter cheniae TaxID=1258888 RepID=A0A3A5M659_9MICC|nr:MarR family transcriptional regulator [Arthrobacter cheniae]RJT81051.1 MarR family transcriptional regulator [Arthrobacter cheniae]